MQKYKKIIIDLFDEGAGAASTATGGNDSGSNTDSAKNTNAVRSDIAKKGRDLGLSDDLMQSYQEAYDSKHESKDNTAAANHDDNTNEGQNSENQIEEEFKNLIKGKYKAPFDKHVRGMVSDRMHTRDSEIAELKSKAESTDKILKVLSLKYPQVDGNDLEALLKAVENDEDVWQQQALNDGITADEAKSRYTENQKQFALEQELNQLKREKAAGELDARLNNLAKSTQQMYPDFNLQAEFENPKFCAALDFIAQRNEARNKESGRNDEIFDLTYAYELAHADEIRNNTINKASKAAISAVTKNIAANGSRPAENANLHSAPAQPKSVSDMSDEEFDVLLNKVKNGTAHIPR